MILSVPNNKHNITFPHPLDVGGNDYDNWTPPVSTCTDEVLIMYPLCQAPPKLSNQCSLSHAKAH